MYGTKRIQYHLKSIIAATNTMQKIPTNANKKNGNICATVHTARILRNHQIHVLRYRNNGSIPPLNLETVLTSHPVLI
jgi:hypothetical protein